MSRKFEEQKNRETVRLRYLRMAPRKVAAVAGLIRGLSVNDAEAHLSVNPRRAAVPLLKLLRSATANAKNNRKIEPDKLRIEKIEVSGGPMFKRYLPRARGVATPILKKTSHVVLVVSESKAAPPRFKIARKTALKKTVKQKAGVKDDRKELKEAKPARREGIFKKMFRRKAI